MITRVLDTIDSIVTSRRSSTLAELVLRVNQFCTSQRPLGSDNILVLLFCSSPADDVKEKLLTQRVASTL